MTSRSVTPESLREAIFDAGVRKGDVLYVASSMLALGRMENALEETLSALTDAVGPEGTLVMPAFNFAYGKGVPFDPANDPAETGALSEAFRVAAGVRRTATPFHSVSVRGAMADDFLALRPVSSFGPGSVFQRLVDLDARYLLLGCGYHEGTIHFHWLEERLEVPYRYWKMFDGQIISDGAARHVHFMCVRRDGVRNDSEAAGQAFERTGLVSIGEAGLCRARGFRLSDFVAHFEPLMRADPWLIARPNGDPVRKPDGMPLLKLDHIGVVSRHSGRIRKFLEGLSAGIGAEGVVPEIGVSCQFLDASFLNVPIEIVEPVRDDSRVMNHWKQMPQAPLHHLAFEVADLDSSVAWFMSRGYAVTDRVPWFSPRPGQRVSFLSPLQTGGLLVELVAYDAWARYPGGSNG